MIPDLIFKKLAHSYTGYNLFSNGNKIEEGYYPDYVLAKQNKFIILECENTSSRKAYIGGLLKAAHFLSGDKHGKLIFVGVPKKNTKLISIAKQLKTYYQYIKPLTNLNEIFIINAMDYYYEGKVLELDSSMFYSKAIRLV